MPISQSGGSTLRLMAHYLAMLLVCCLALPVGIAHAEDSDYKLGSDDLLKIGVFDHPELSVDVRISKSGNITFPLLGTINAAGLTTHALEEVLSQKLRDGAFVTKPQVSVLVAEYQSQKVAVMGQVMKPGQYALTTSNRVLDLLAQAGGVVNSVSGTVSYEVAGDVATLIRRDGTKVTIDLPALFSGDAAQNPAVVGGDTIFVARAPIVYIYGQVQKPGPVKLERNMTVIQAISDGGGLTPKGSLFRMRVKRKTATGKVYEVPVKSQDLLQPDDVLEIKERWF